MENLLDQKIWICWNKTIVKGKMTKKPCSITGGETGTDESHRSTWVNYADAATAAKTNGFSGIGFIIPKGCFFLDIDHRDQDDPLVKLLIERFATYTERSISKTGFHLYGQCDLSKIPTDTSPDGKQKLSRAFYTKNPDNQIELYIGGLTNRFAVYTGDAFNDNPFNECTQAVLTTLDKDMRKKGKQNFSSKRDGRWCNAWHIHCRCGIRLQLLIKSAWSGNPLQ